ncbi:MAG: UDP-3-O-(3-hydroxymyristoyl)glucosamine N-acyltransferase [Burkholderiaceae bacterium]
MRPLLEPVSLEQVCAALDVPAPSSDIAIHAMASLAQAGERDLSFLSDSRYKAAARQTSAAAALIRADDADALPSSCVPVIVPDPYLAFAKAAQFFEEALSKQDASASDLPTISPSAVISPNAELGDDVSVGPGAVIGDHAVLGDRVALMANVSIGARAVIGADSILHPNVSVYPDVSVGQACQIHANTVLGSDGFGFARQGEGWAKIPQLGSVRIGDRCEIGSNTSIDRGALDDTVLGNDCIVDNLVQIAHNVTIGDGTAIAGCVGIAGSAKIGKRCLIGGAVGIIGHLEIADDVMISPMTFIASSVREAGFYSGTFPVQKHRDWERVAAVLKQLPDLRSRLRQLEKLSRET